MHSLFGGAGKASSEDITFLVPDKGSVRSASSALEKVRMPKAPEFEALGEAYSLGEMLLRKFRPRDIKIVPKPGMSADEIYRANEKTLREQISERDAIALIIDKMIHPVISVVAEDRAVLKEQARRIGELEERVREFQGMMRETTGRAPVVPALPGGKTVWGGTVKSVALDVLQAYQKDTVESTGRYRSLRDASDQFFDRYFFSKNPAMTKEMFYEDVKKTNNRWFGDKKGRIGNVAMR